MRKCLVSLMVLILCVVLIIVISGCKVNNIQSSDTKPLPSSADVNWLTNPETASPPPMLTAKDVQFDMIGNLDKYFAIDGYAELDNYYNYGFDKLEEKFFCIRVTPIDTNSDEWYLYGLRSDDGLKTFFDKLKNEGSIHIIADCDVPKSLYEEGQGNLAFLLSVKY